MTFYALIAATVYLLSMATIIPVSRGWNNWAVFKLIPLIIGLFTAWEVVIMYLGK